MAKLTFAKCDCGAPNTHGYFAHDEYGRFPTPTMSIAEGEDVISLGLTMGDITEEDATAVREQLRSIGLPETFERPEPTEDDLDGLLAALFGSLGGGSVQVINMGDLRGGDDLDLDDDDPDAW